MTLIIHYRYQRSETLRNIKTKKRALEIIANRGKVTFAEFGGEVIYGSRPASTKHETPTLEDLAKQHLGIN